MSAVADVGVGVPSGWPIIDDGLFMAYVGRIMVVHLDVTMSDRVFDRHVEELARAIDTRFVTFRVGVLYDVPSLRAIQATRRQRIASLLELRKEKLRQTTAGYALATASPVVRGALRAVFWVSPPPYPYAITGTTREGFEFLAAKVSGVDAALTNAAYLAALHVAQGEEASKGA